MIHPHLYSFCACFSQRLTTLLAKTHVAFLTSTYLATPFLLHPYLTYSHQMSLKTIGSNWSRIGYSCAAIIPTKLKSALPPRARVRAKAESGVVPLIFSPIRLDTCIVSHDGGLSILTGRTHPSYSLVPLSPTKSCLFATTGTRRSAPRI